MVLANYICRKTKTQGKKSKDKVWLMCALLKHNVSQHLSCQCYQNPSLCAQCFKRPKLKIPEFEVRKVYQSKRSQLRRWET